MTPSQIISYLKKHKNSRALAGMVRFGISSKNTLGVAVPVLRDLAKKIKTDQQLALALWQSGIHEARILASMIADPKKFTAKNMDNWTKDFDSWDVCDQTCLNLYFCLPRAHQKAKFWAKDKKEFVRRAGFALMAVLAVKDKRADDNKFIQFFPLIKKYAIDERNFVKKAVNWALRQIGKRNKRLNKIAISWAKDIKKIDSKSAKWVASNALSELQSSAVQKRLAIN